MDAIIKTGFKKINHRITFQPNTQSKGKALVLASHVKNVEELRKNGQSNLIQARIIRQTSVTSEPYYAKLYIDDKRLITDVYCNCVYNQSKKCKHVAALIYFVNHEESLTKTDHEQQWGKPSISQISKEKYSKGKFFYEMRMNAKKPKSISKSCDDIDTILTLKNPSPLKLICASMNLDDSKHVIADLLTEITKGVKTNLKLEECHVCIENLLLFAAEYPVYSNELDIPNNLKDFYKNHIFLCSEDILKLSCDTLGQAKDKNWFLSRKKRISASKNAHEIKCRKTKTIEKLLSEMISDKTFSSRSTKYGNLNESNARELYEKQFNIQVILTGFTVSMFQPWLGASLDGVVVKNGIILRIVEFKCPASCEKKPIVDGRKSNVPYLKYEGGCFLLSKSHMYYTQCQMQMYISGQSICDLFLWSPVGSYCVPVYRDETFIKAVVLQCESFYFIHYLPEVYKLLNKKGNNDTF
ncbi:uncharacterized protein LOC126886347 [Diabrotica virgifera virgifera]|uniref:SWIM-type domain-containing protein n=1 Tax=Diabrotica virgifera virgifera TaxID=50390 RepID=A0ABM5KG60_DIAVI|nr:uncharacterized protein LOC126886347 [Diabrotica virgifera virgifera]